MDSFTGKLAVVTGGGSGMGRELARQRAAQGCSVATCDLNADSVTGTAALARTGAPADVRVTSHSCDLAEKAQVLRFRDELLEQHASDHVDLVFNNAGIGGGESFANTRAVAVGPRGHVRILRRPAQAVRPVQATRRDQAQSCERGPNGAVAYS